METIKIITLIAGIIFAIDLATLTIMVLININELKNVNEQLIIFMKGINYDRKDKE